MKNKKSSIHHPSSIIYTPIIGMEVHAELKTNSKMFCGCKNDPFHAPKPNVYTCPVCLGMPGALPVANKKAIEWTIKLGLALNCTINLFSKFDRKNYFYPDLPKGYQISQYDIPFCEHGILETEEGPVRIRRIHLEEDTGKLIHQTISVNSANRHPEKSSRTPQENTKNLRHEYSGPTEKIVEQKVSLVDFNRGGVPLVEIVTEPDIHSAAHAKAYGKKLRQILRFLDISDCNMEQGSLRLEANISLLDSFKLQATSNKRLTEEDLPKYKVEVKNINSFGFLEKAVAFEIDRQSKILAKGEVPTQETRGWNEKKSETFSQRSKEDAEDYRYFPDPDLPPILFTQKQIDELKSQLPELPDQIVERWGKEYQVEKRYAQVLTVTPTQTQQFEAIAQLFVQNKQDVNKLANLLVNKKLATQLLESPDKLLKTFEEFTHVDTVDTSELETIIASIIKEQPKAVTDYQAGKTQIIGFLMGQVMRKLGKKVDPQSVKTTLEKQLTN